MEGWPWKAKRNNPMNEKIRLVLNEIAELEDEEQEESKPDGPCGKHHEVGPHRVLFFPAADLVGWGKLDLVR